MKKIVLFLIGFAFTTVSAVTQNTILNQKTFPISKNAEWWEPDTVTFYRNSLSSSSGSRLTYKYNEIGMKSGETYYVKNSNEWLLSYELQYTHDEKRNLLSKTYLTNDPLVNVYRLLYTYNERDKMISEIKEYWDNGIWSVDVEIFESSPPYMKIYTYDNEDNLLSTLLQVRQNGEWKNASIISNLYDHVSNSKIKTWQSWKDEIADWNNHKRHLYEFDERDNLISESNQFWSNDQWGYVNYSDTQSYSILEEYTYDENNNLLTRSYKIWMNDEWVKRSSEQNTYDSYSNLLTHTEYEWDGNAWLELSSATYTYGEENNILTCTTSYRRNGIMTLTDLILKEYDINYNCTSTLIQRWSDGLWNNKLFYNDTFDENGNCVSGTAQRWKDGGWIDYDTDLMFKYNNNQSISATLSTCNRFEVSYTKVNNPLKLEKNEMENILIYPNPTQDKIYISTPPNIKTQKIELYNISGQKLGEYNQTDISISHLPTGIYFIKITSNAFNFTRKIIKQ